MNWTESVISQIDKNQLQVINDSKTPSGPPHVGSLRGVLIHDAIFKVLQSQGYDVKYMFGCDDFDPVDEVPKGQNEHFEKYLGMPLCKVPAPQGSIHKNMSTHFIYDFFESFKKLGVSAQTYRTSEYYLSGQFNDAIDKILSNSQKIRNIYLNVSGSERNENWHPFQTICENCGRIGTTEVTKYENNEVVYICRPDLVTWAKGCGHKGKMSPFDGNGKLPWKLEWVAKWMVFGVTIEGAGMDHTTKGGSRDIAKTVLEQVFNLKSPVNIPYGFFLLEGAKMSSSKGIGATAKEMIEFLSPEILRFLMLRTPPKRSINFGTDEKNIEKIHNDFDSTRESAFSNINTEDTLLNKEIYNVSDLSKENYIIPSFSIIKVLIQLPHININKEAEKLKGSLLNNLEIERINHRIETAKYWLDNFATDEDKFELQQNFPNDIYKNLSIVELGFLKRLEKDMDTIEWNEKNIKQLIFDSARLTPILPKLAFKSIYSLFLNKDQGPQVNGLLYYLEKDFIKKRLQEVVLNYSEYWQNTASSISELKEYLTKEINNITKIDNNIEFLQDNSLGVLELFIFHNDGKCYIKRVLKLEIENSPSNNANDFKQNCKVFLDNLLSEIGINI